MPAKRPNSRRDLNVALERLVGKLPPALYDPLVDCLGIETQFPAAFGNRPPRRDDVVRGLVPELVGVLGGWIGHVGVLSLSLSRIPDDWLL